MAALKLFKPDDFFKSRKACELIVVKVEAAKILAVFKRLQRIDLIAAEIERTQCAVVRKGGDVLYLIAGEMDV